MVESSNIDPFITVIVNNDLLKVSVRLNPKDQLSNVRKKLEKNSKVVMDTLLLFARILPTKDNLLEVIRRDDENVTTLEETMDTENNILYLQEYSWEYFIKEYKLEHGYIMTSNNDIVKADKKAFTIKNCKITRIGEKKTIETPGNSRTRKIDVIEHMKVSLSFKLEPTNEFIDRIKEAIISTNKKLQESLKEITNEYGQFFSEEIILGGQVYFKDSSKDKYKLFVGGKKVDSTFDETEWSENLNDLTHWNCIKLTNPISVFQVLIDRHLPLHNDILSSVGEKVIYTYTEDYNYKLKPSGKEIKSIPQDVLKMVRNEDDRCKIFATVVDVKEKDIFNCQISHQHGQDPKLIIHCIQKKFKVRKCNLKIRWMIIGYDINFRLNSSNYDVRLKEWDVQNCEGHTYKCFLKLNNKELLCFGIPKFKKLDRSNESLVIGHHFFDDQVNQNFGLYTFSYSLGQKQYVKLPDFTFYLFIITCNTDNTDDYGKLSFNNRVSNWPNIVSRQKPKFVSLYSTGENRCGRVYLKQKVRGIKMKYIKCDNNDRLHELDNLKHAYFQANHNDNNWFDKLTNI
ncbi:hypothetical protein RclHR1_01020007 [Rhizophagus clarus]|uniref:DUF7431 domain-containing protein n=1 Tax=Rhizophagus clarus TaxID=94130 RepID=A0A2Z6QSZ6_9GLOM|nr:hypothetical protein RclHR1_01020007 [Rhizophagus clarus]